MVMVSNATGFTAGHLFGSYPGKLGHLYSPGGQRGPWKFAPYALDNGAWSCFTRNLEFNHDAWLRLLDWSIASGKTPLWSLVPDVVADRDRTIERWNELSPTVRGYGLKPAFAVQDGMTFEDVPSDDCILFLGGTTSWKVAAIEPWCERFPGRVHVARVNNRERLMKCYWAGAVSVDGTGWFHSKSRSPRDKKATQYEDLVNFLETYP